MQMQVRERHGSSPFLQSLKEYLIIPQPPENVNARKGRIFSCAGGRMQGGFMKDLLKTDRKAGFISILSNFFFQAGRKRKSGRRGAAPA
ncbi:MAG: hypothetical protein GX637_01570 [Clostridiales bacterium]|nr:hypothetical protein [Clostridiales bacterium]